jgi:hypothetical protein
VSDSQAESGWVAYVAFTRFRHQRPMAREGMGRCWFAAENTYRGAAYEKVITCGLGK